MRYFALLLLLFGTLLSVQGQVHLPERDNPSVKQNLKPGIFLSFENFKNNDPINPEDINSEIDPYARNYYYLLFKEKFIYVKKGGQAEKIKVSSVWGYNDGNEIYLHEKNFANFFKSNEINSEHTFARINFFGTLSLVHYINSGNDSYDPVLGIYGTGKKKPVEFIFDSRDGKIYPAKLRNLKKLIADDQQLLAELKNHKGDRDIKLYLYLKQYNTRNPIHF